MPAGWEHFEHKADIGIRGFGLTPKDAFAQAALAMTAIVTDPGTVLPSESVVVHCHEQDLEILFVDWLNEVIYEMATRNMLFSRFEVHIGEDGRLDARLHGETVDRTRHHPAVEIKGATFTELAVHRQEDDMWVAQCVVDV